MVIESSNNKTTLASLEYSQKNCNEDDFNSIKKHLKISANLLRFMGAFPYSEKTDKMGRNYFEWKWNSVPSLYSYSLCSMFLIGVSYGTIKNLFSAFSSTSPSPHLE